nr:cholinephosphotransferase 1-like [Dermatophagoides farinae]
MITMESSKKQLQSSLKQKTYDFFPRISQRIDNNDHWNGEKERQQQTNCNQRHVRKSSLNIPKSLAELRDTVRAENIALKSDHDHKTSKRSVGGWALRPDQLKYLKDHVYEYNASAGSILEVWIMQRFWTYLATFIPKFVAPCTITAIGFFINLITCSLIIAYSPDARSEVPTWTLFLCAIGVWLYQIADALDGKQCYKVQNSQLEEFYDHGCDSVSTILLMYATGIAIQAGQSPTLFLLVLFISLFAFYTTHWLSYVTNQMVFGKIDVTEAQWTMILTHLVTAVYGQSIWNYQIHVGTIVSIELRTLLSFATLITLFNSIIYQTSIILLGRQTPLEKAGVKIERNKNFNPYKPLLAPLFLSVLIYYCYTNGYYHMNPAMFILFCGLSFAKMTMKLVIAHCTNHEIELLDLTLVAPILLALNHFFFVSNNNSNHYDHYRFVLVSPDQALLCAFIWNTIELIRYFTFVSWDICIALDVNIFSIKYPPGHPKSRLQTGGFYVNGLNNDELLKNIK